MANDEPALSPRDVRRLWLLAICAVIIAATVVCYILLYIFVPAGTVPREAVARDIAAAYARTISLAHLALTPGAFTGISLALQAAMWAAFFTAIALLCRLADGPAEPVAFKLVAAGSALASSALILTPPILATDIYYYALFGRMIVTRGLNPYVTPGNALAGDPIWAHATLRDLPTHHGPLFIGLSVVAAGVGGGGMVATALAFKILATAFGALAAWSVVSLARLQQRSGLAPLGLVALNPLILIETAGNGRNEIVMLGLAFAGLVVAGRGRPNLGFAMLVGSVHIKWVTAALAGLFAIARLRQTVGWRARMRELARLLFIAVGVTVLLYLPFWTKDIARGTRMLLIAGNGGGGLHLSQLLLFGVTALSAIVVVARSGERHLLEMAALTCFGFVLFVFPWWMPWYLITPLTLLAVGPFGRLNTTLVAIVMAFSLVLMMICSSLVTL